MTLLQVISFLLAALGGTAMVLTRQPLTQAMVLSLYGLLLALLYLVVQAPNVAISELAVGSAALPLILLVMVAKVRGCRK